MELVANPGKKIIIEIDGIKWARYPIKTHFITEKDNLDEIIKKYVLPNAQTGDIICLGQKIVSILQGLIIYKKDLKVGWWANFLSKFVKKTPHGFSVGNPLKMQIAINLAGLPRILFAAVIAGISKIFGFSGVFYRLAGHQISQIDGFYAEAFPQYGEMGILGPKNCNELCENSQKKYNLSFLVIDINDLGGNILGCSKDLAGKEELILKILKDNPAGQSNQQTPIIILRQLCN